MQKLLEQLNKLSQKTNALDNSIAGNEWELIVNYKKRLINLCCDA